MDTPHSPTEMAKFLPAGWDLAVCTAVFFQGVLCAQLMRYANGCKRDSVQLKLFVAGLALLTWLKTIQAFAMLWVQDVTLFANVDLASSLWVKNPLFHTSVVASAVVAFYVQMFFCYRLWAIGRNLYLVIVTTTLFVFAVAASIVATYLTFNDMLKSLDWIATYLGAALGGDLILTGGIVFSLLRHRQVVLPRGQTAKMLNALLRLTIQSAAPAAIAAAINFVACMELNSSADWIRPQLIISEISNMMLPMMYAITAMWTLNSRPEIRAVVEDGPIMHTLGLVPESDASSGPNMQSIGVAVTSQADEEQSVQSVRDEKLQPESREVWVV
ncbi:hypothetical protein DFH06DRAFT_1425763 [Mycena polygramma]|nr:hypothetical protein DFH06DRAFT_1425763 [Mycena polygramma]